MRKLEPMQIAGIVLAVAIVAGGLVFAFDKTPVAPTRFSPYVEAPKAPPAIVSNSEYDGSVRQVKEWFQSNLDDPKSLEIVKWRRVKMSGDSTMFIVDCRYRATNEYGAKILQSKKFHLDLQGKVIDVLESNWGAAQ